MPSPTLRRETGLTEGEALRQRRRQHALSFARNVLGRGDITLKPELADLISYTLARDEELENPSRDEWGNWEYQCSARAKTGDPASPWLDELVLGSFNEAPRSRVVEPIWPKGQQFALCLTHDVDGVSSRSHEKKFVRRLMRVLHADGPKRVAALQAAGSLYRLATGIGKPDHLGRFEEWLGFESQLGFRSTWYFLPSDYARVHVFDMDYRYEDAVVFEGRQMAVSDMMKAIHALGGDIGLHGSYLSPCDVTLLKDQIQQVERAVGQPVRSTRQHFLRYDAGVTPSVQSRAGCESDSTQGFNTSIGCRAGTSFPFRAWDHQANGSSNVLEIPMHIMDVALLRTASGKPEEAVRIGVELMNRVAKIGGCLTLNWHPNLIHQPHYFQIYRTLLQEAAAKGAWGCCASELTDWWIAREARLNRNAHQLY
jgi:hypothetical protein